MKAVASGRITVFPRDGAYQLYCDTLIPEGVGDLAVAFQQLKEKLWKEGLFDPAHKKPLPPYPERIAIVTSGAGAAVHDMIRILRRRYPIAKVILLPVRVQGPEAPPEIVGAIRYADKWKIGDVIITGRGGGSMEDLWAFNDEGVARAIYDCETPVISAVGHEPDVTIADFVADARASTPSNAAELAVPDQNDVAGRLNQLSARMERAMTRRLGELSSKLERLSGNRTLQNPMNYIEDRRVLLDYQRTRLAHGLSGSLSRERQRFARLAASLDAMSPLAVLGRGYAVARDENGRILKSYRETAPGSRVSVTLGEGGFKVRHLAGDLVAGLAQLPGPLAVQAHNLLGGGDGAVRAVPRQGPQGVHLAVQLCLPLLLLRLDLLQVLPGEGPLGGVVGHVDHPLPVGGGLVAGLLHNGVGGGQRQALLVLLVDGVLLELRVKVPHRQAALRLRCGRGRGGRGGRRLRRGFGGGLRRRGGLRRAGHRRRRR